MMNSVINTLVTNGFETTKEGAWWGCGAVCSWGHTVYVRYIGRNRYEVKHHHWCYDEWGEEVANEVSNLTLWGADLLGYLFSNLPRWGWRWRNR